jgi:dTDP-6-deoxy-L-talose 4-dehydrogenase (NAD+)
MYGKGQSPKSLFSQLDKAIEEGQETFNMSGGEQIRDYLPIEKVAEYIVRISLQNKVDGIINCCSGQPISVKELVKNYLAAKRKNIYLNLGYYPYPDYEPMRFWGDDKKLKTIINNG